MKRFSTWDQWSDWAHRCWNRLREAVPPEDTPPLPAPEMREYLRRLDCRFRDACQTYILDCAQRGRWSPSARRVDYFLRNRLYWAKQVLWLQHLLAKQQAITPPPAPQLMLQWLLIDAWESGGGQEVWLSSVLAGQATN